MAYSEYGTADMIPMALLDAVPKGRSVFVAEEKVLSQLGIGKAQMGRFRIRGATIRVVYEETVVSADQQKVKEFRGKHQLLRVRIDRSPGPSGRDFLRADGGFGALTGLHTHQIGPAPVFKHILDGGAIGMESNMMDIGSRLRYVLDNRQYPPP